MKPLILLSSLGILLAACGGGAPADQGSGAVNVSSNVPVSSGSLDDKKVICVSQGGFLTPSGNDFSCRMPNGNNVNLWSL